MEESKAGRGLKVDCQFCGKAVEDAAMLELFGKGVAWICEPCAQPAFDKFNWPKRVPPLSDREKLRREAAALLLAMVQGARSDAERQELLDAAVRWASVLTAALDASMGGEK